MAIIQEFDDLPPQQRAVAEAMQQDYRLHYAIDTQVGFSVDPVEASLLFDGSVVIPRDGFPYLRRHLPRAVYLIDLGLE